MDRRISEVQAKISLRKANEERQYGQGAVPRFGNNAGKIIDLFAVYVEEQMKVPPKGGRGCRVQKEHIDLCFGKFYQAMREFMDSEKADEKALAKNHTVYTALQEKNRKLAKELKEQLGDEE